MHGAGNLSRWLLRPPKNGDLWTVASVNADGSLSVTHDGHGRRVTLPAAYVAANTELG